MCRHKWVEVSKVYHDPLTLTKLKIDGEPAEYIAQMLWGVTVILQRCHKCERYRHFEIPGRV